MEVEVKKPTTKIVFSFTQEDADAMKKVGDLLDDISRKLDELVYEEKAENLDIRDDYEKRVDCFALTNVLNSARDIISALDEVCLEPDDIRDAVDCED